MSSVGDTVPPPSLVVRTVRLGPDASADLLDLLPDEHPVAWVRRGEGLVGWGVAARDPHHRRRPGSPTPTSGGARPPPRAVVRDEVERARHRPGLLRLVRLRRRARRLRAGRAPRWSSAAAATRAWLTTDLPARPGPARRRSTSGPTSRGRPGRRPLRRRRAQRRAVDVGRRRRRPPDQRRRRSRRSCSPATWWPPPTRPIDVRWPLRRLAEDYPMCWTFHVDGLFGATPEMLVRRERGLVTSRVLAGTIRRTGDDERDLALAAALARSSKDLEEHEYAVRSVADALDPHCSSMNVPEAPFVLHLPNVMHLATDVAGVVHDAATVSLAAARRVAAPLGGRRRHPDSGRGRADRRDRGHGPRPLRRPGRLDGRRRRRRVGHRAALRAPSTAAPSGSSPAAASSPTPTPRPSWPRPRRSSCRCGTPSPAAEGRARECAGYAGNPSPLAASRRLDGMSSRVPATAGCVSADVTGSLAPPRLLTDIQ